MKEETAPDQLVFLRQLDWLRAVTPCAPGKLTTIRCRILIAFLAMAVITGSLAWYGTEKIRDAGVLVRKTYDQSLMSINYARAASADFAGMRAAFARRWITEDDEVRAQLDQSVQRLFSTLREDLAIAAQRTQGTRSRTAAERVERAVAIWLQTATSLTDQTKLDANWNELDALTRKADEQLELLVNYTAGDGFLYRQLALATVDRDITFNVLGAMFALGLSGVVAWRLTRRVVGPLAAASEIADCIATGRLDIEIPTGGRDELGHLLDSMRLMRDNIRSMVNREVSLRRSAQTRLADALESSPEGFVVVDSTDHIVLANHNAAALLGVSADVLQPGIPVSQVGGQISHFASATGTHSVQHDGPVDIRVQNGRWLRLSHSKTREGGAILVCSDITGSKIQEETLRQSNMRLDAALDNMSQGLCMFGGDNCLELINRRFYELFKITSDKIVAGKTLNEILELERTADDATRSAIRVLREQAEANHASFSGTRHHEIDGGRTIESIYSGTKSGGWVASFDDVTERRLAESRIMHMARHDALTDLPNRALFREQIESALNRGEQLAILFIDLDRFKTVNDTLGHSSGDALLCAVTKRLQAAVSGRDTVARLGGDEFAIIQLDATPESARGLAEQIIEALAEPFAIAGNEIVVGTSVGIAVAPTDGSDPDHLLRNSDMALYRAKGSGRGCYHFFHSEMDADMRARHNLEQDLRKAIADSAFELHYQPILQMDSGRICSMEALIRWRHPTQGMISPRSFIPFAEEIGLIGQIGDWVLRQACRDAVRWPENVSVAVNLSAVQFRNRALALSIVSALADAGLVPQRLEIEITEGVLLQDDPANLQALHDIREMGVRISMDDFGTGYSSLSYLRKFPFDKIKIDRSFVSELGKKDDCLAIVRAVAQLGVSLGIATVAEGVDTREQLSLLRREGVTHVQGFLFSRPRPAHEIPRLIERRVEIAA